METAQVESEYSELWVLQWSHSLSAMETGPMGRVGQHGLRAFNGATAFRPWKLALPHPTDDWHLRLQWSHSLSAMETSSWRRITPAQPILQWSHSLSAMETGRPLRLLGA